MKLAYSTNAYMRWSIAAAIERIAKLGYTGVELMADEPHAWPESTSDSDLENILRELSRHQSSISNINAFMMNAVGDFWHPSWIDSKPAQRRRRIEHTKAALTMARKLGAPHITTEPGGPLEPGMTREWAMDAFVDGLMEVLEHARNEGVLLLVEPEPGLLIESANQFLDLAERVDSSAFGLNFDVGHFYCVHELLPETIDRLKTFTRHYHIEDIPASREHHHLIPGTGAIEFRPLIEAICRTGYAGWLTVELYPYLDDPDAAGRSAWEFLAPMLIPSKAT